MAIFYTAPEPRQAYPKVLPVTPGAQPQPAGPLGGSGTVLSVIGVWSALAAVPMPTQKPLNVVPLTLVYGQQPPRIEASPKVQARAVIASWPDAGEPRLQFNSQQPERRYIVPLTLIYGQEPPRIDPLPRVQARAIGMSWPEAGEPRLQWNDQQPERRFVVAQTLKYGQQPPITAGLTTAQMALVRSSWPEDGEPRLQPHNHYPERKRYIAPQTLVYGQQPPVSGPLSIQEMAIARASWEPPFQYPAELEGIAAVYIAPAVNNPPPSPLIVPDLIRRQFKDWTMIALTLPGVIRTTPADPPPPAGPITPAEMALIRSAWEPPHQYPRSAPPSAAWNVPLPSPHLAFIPSPWWIGAIWSAPFPDIQYSGSFIPDSVDLPPLVGVRAQIRSSLFARSWEAPYLYPESESNNAGWNFIVPFVPSPKFQHSLRWAWEPPYQFPQILIGTAAWSILAVTLDRAIALSDGSASLVFDSRTIPLVSGQNITISINSSE